VQDHRARQFSQDWKACTPAEQARLAEATIAIGDTTKMVYIALGTPDYTLPYETETQRWTWVYWGISPQSENGKTGHGQIHFLSRSEMRFPRPGEQRRALRVEFENDELTNWELTSIEVTDALRKETLRMGDFPTP
jgi:hypothetical protein